MNFKAIAASCGSALSVSLLGVAGLSTLTIAPASAETLFKQTNLVSDGAVPAKIIDPDLVNPWGLAASPTSPFWVSDNGTGLATIYPVAGSDGVTKAGLTVTIPPASGLGTSAPTGQVFNGAGPGTFKLGNGSSAVFLFDSEDGAISGWNGGTTAQIAVTTPDAVYKGLAIDNGSGRLFATNFHAGDVEMYDSGFNPLGSFTDPTLPSGYAPFNARVLDGALYVTFALQDADKHDDVGGPGHGFVDVFNLDGTFNERLISQGELNSPWGLEIAPSSFGSFAGDLLVGNFGDGTIGAYDKATGAFVDDLRGMDGNPISITDLWALSIGNDGMGGSSNSLYFTAGLVDEGDGLFGSLTAIPEPGTWSLVLLGFAGIGYAAHRGGKKARSDVAAF